MRFSLGISLLALAVAGGGSPALAVQRVVTLSVAMNCPTCPYIVKRTLAKVDGVTKVMVSYREQEAVVTFDDARTSVDALTRATAAVGFRSKAEGPARLRGD